MNNEIKKVGAGFGVLVIRDNKILLGKRHEDPEKASSEMNGEGTWTMPGGKLEYGESFENGAIRELKEETNIEAQEVELICVENSIGPNAHFITIGLHAVKFTGEAEVREPDEITEWKWFELDALPEKLFLPSKYVLERYLDKSFYKKSE